jgi:transcriptional regulator with XRE-family HTH domain
MHVALGRLISRERTTRRWSQERLAEKVVAAGVADVHQVEVSRWESGEYPPDPEQLVAIANIFELSLYEMLALPHPPAPAGHYLVKSGEWVIDLDAQKENDERVAVGCSELSSPRRARRRPAPRRWRSREPAGSA